MAFPFIRKVRPSPSKTLEELIESFTLNIFGPAPSLKPSILKSAFDWFEVAPFDQSEIGDWGEAVAEMYVVVVVVVISKNYPQVNMGAKCMSIL